MPLQLCMLLLVTGCNMFLTGRPLEVPSSPPGSTGFPGLACWPASFAGKADLQAITRNSILFRDSEFCSECVVVYSRPFGWGDILLLCRYPVQQHLTKAEPLTQPGTWRPSAVVSYTLSMQEAAQASCGASFHNLGSSCAAAPSSPERTCCCPALHCLAARRVCRK